MEHPYRAEWKSEPCEICGHTDSSQDPCYSYITVGTDLKHAHSGCAKEYSRANQVKVWDMDMVLLFDNGRTIPF